MRKEEEEEEGMMADESHSHWRTRPFVLED
jgi:hypothetical protein